MKAGRYDFSSDSDSSQYWQQKRGDMNKQLADYLAKRQEFVNTMSAKEEADVKREQLDRDTDWHGSTFQGAQMGLTASGGNPFGALIGGIIGSAVGMGKAIKARKDSGQGLGKSIFGTLTDFFPSERAMQFGQSAASTIGPMVQARKQQAPMFAQQQTAGPSTSPSPYSPGKLQLDPELLRRFGGRGPSYTG